MKIICAKHGGFCFGVTRAIKMAIDAVKEEKKVYSLGPLIHNPIVVNTLGSRGIMTVGKIEDIRDKSKSVIIRSHGVHPAILEEIKKRGIKMIDATCPKVRRAQRFVEKLARDGYFVVIVGEKDHPEVRGLLGYAMGKAKIYSESITLRSKKIGVVPQTTLNVERLNDAVFHLLPLVVEMKIYNTICDETAVRIEEAVALARLVDMMIVVGGKNSANTTRLYQICRSIKPSYHIESAEEISKKWFQGVKSVGVTAGASTPKEQLKKIRQFLNRLG